MMLQRKTAIWSRVSIEVGNTFPSSLIRYQQLHCGNKVELVRNGIMAY